MCHCGRQVGHLERRLTEAAKLGFTQVTRVIELPQLYTWHSRSRLLLAGQEGCVVHRRRDQQTQCVAVMLQVIVPYPVKGPSTKAFQKTAARLQGVKLTPCRTVAEVRSQLNHTCLPGCS